jgi:hypothetical protein
MILKAILIFLVVIGVIYIVFSDWGIHGWKEAMEELANSIDGQEEDE